jgi:hypothetical protein
MSIGFNGNGLRHSEAMRLVERYTRVDAQTIQWEVTIEDPRTYAQPFKMALPIRLQNDYPPSGRQSSITDRQSPTNQKSSIARSTRSR